MSTPAANQSAAKRLRLRVTAAAESHVRAGHPWVFADSVLQTNREGKTGELAVIFDRKDKFLAVGLYDSDSPIRVRILHAGKPLNIDVAWWAAHLQQAVVRRDGLFDGQTNGFRLIHGENDGWPGLVIDKYDSTLVVKLYSAAWLPRWGEILTLIRELIPCERIIARLSRNIQSQAGKFQLSDGQIVFGATLDGPVIFSENGIRFEAEVLRGQKTGFFLDQRENRSEVESFARGKNVLNAFSFSGGFSVYAARGGAKSVMDLDISQHALASARRNFSLNANLHNFNACRHETVQADAFKWIEESTARFDLIVLDPPSLAKRAAEREGALRAYERLNMSGIARLAPNGILVAASCSAHVSKDEFFETVRRAAVKSGRQFSELKTKLHPPDHPATFREAEYLKTIYLKF